MSTRVTTPQRWRLLPLLLVLVAVVPPPLAFALPRASAGRVALAWSAFYWTPVVAGVAWLMWTNYAFTSTVADGALRVWTLRGRLTLPLDQLDVMRSLSLWGQYGPTHALRLHTSDGAHALVILATPLTGLNRRNAARAVTVRAALAPHAELADPRGRAWLGAGPRPSRLTAARHVVAMLAVYLLVIVVALFGVAGFITAALH